MLSDVERGGLRKVAATFYDRFFVYDYDLIVRDSGLFRRGVPLFLLVCFFDIASSARKAEGVQ
jgi:hypothetical protein